MDYASWCSLSDEELARRDIAEVNLAAAFYCPHAVDLDIKALCRKVDRWADHVSDRTAVWFRTLRHRPEYRHDSDARFRVLAMVTVPLNCIDMPPPKHDGETQLYPVAYKEFQRILPNRERSRNKKRCANGKSGRRSLA